MKRVKITITDMDSTVLDSFIVIHWQDGGNGIDNEALEQAECYGSPASESLLMEKIIREINAAGTPASVPPAIY